MFYFSGDSIHQQEFIETYLQLMTAALEDEYFVCDYHERYNVGAQNEMFTSCTEMYPFVLFLIYLTRLSTSETNYHRVECVFE